MKKSLENIPDYIVIIFVTALLIIDFLPHAEAIDPIYPQFLYLSILNFIIALYILFNVKTANYNTSALFKKSYLFWAFLTFIILCGLSALKARNTTLVIEKLVELIVAFCIFINFAILLKNKLHLISKIVLIVCIAAFLQSGIEIYYFKQNADKNSIVNALSLLAARTGNINVLAASLTIKIPFIFIGIIHFLRTKRIFLYITLFIASVTILLIASRTAIISLTLIYILCILYNFKINSITKSSLLTTLGIVIPVILSFFVANIIFEKSKNNGRYVSVANRIEQINTKDASANERLLIWGNTIELTKTNPIMGIGLGNYKIESIPLEKTQRDDSNISLHSHNDFLEIAAETGIINSLIYLSLFVFVFFVNLKKIFKSEQIDNKAIAMLTLMLTIVYGMDALLNFPMFRPTMLIFLCLILIFTLINEPETKEVHTYSLRNTYLVIALICIPVVYFTFLGYKASKLEHFIQIDNANSFTNNILTGDEVIAQLPEYKNTLSTAESFYEYAAIYYIHENKYDQALKYLSKADKINPNFGRIYFYKMIISNAKKNTDSAFVYAKDAFYLRPRNLNFYKMAAQFARAKNDTHEILKEHKTFIQYRNIPEAWKIASEELQKANYDYAELIGFINQGIKNFPTDSLLIKHKNSILALDYIKEGQFYLTKNSSAKALESFTKALKADPANADTMQHLAYLYYDTHDYNQSIAYFLKALKLRQFNSGRTEFFIGDSYLKINDKENACKYFTISNSKGFADAKKQIEVYCK